MTPDRPEVWATIPSREELSDARVYVHQLEKKDWPLNIVELVDYLTHNDFHHVLTADQVTELAAALKVNGSQLSAGLVTHHALIVADNQHESKDLSPLIEKVERLHYACQLNRGQPLVYRRNICEYALLRLPYSERWLSHSYCSPWYRPVPWFGHEDSIPSLSELPIPAPIMFYGMYQCHNHSTNPNSIAQSLVSHAVLAAARLESTHEPSCGPKHPMVLYPCFVWQGSDISLADAINGGANAAANCLAKLQGLFDKANRVTQNRFPQECHLPVFVLSVHDSSWELFVAFLRAKEVHMVTIWKGDVEYLWPCFQIQFIVECCLPFIFDVYRPLLQQILTAIYDSPVNKALEAAHRRRESLRSHHRGGMSNDGNNTSEE